jgi:hypothetical protein
VGERGRCKRERGGGGYIGREREEEGIKELGEEIR